MYLFTETFERVLRDSEWSRIGDEELACLGARATLQVRSWPDQGVVGVFARFPKPGEGADVRLLDRFERHCRERGWTKAGEGATAKQRVADQQTRRQPQPNHEPVTRTLQEWRLLQGAHAAHYKEALQQALDECAAGLGTTIEVVDFQDPLTWRITRRPAQPVAEPDPTPEPTPAYDGLRALPPIIFHRYNAGIWAEVSEAEAVTHLTTAGLGRRRPETLRRRLLLEVDLPTDWAPIENTDMAIRTAALVFFARYWDAQAAAEHQARLLDLIQANPDYCLETLLDNHFGIYVRCRP